MYGISTKVTSAPESHFQEALEFFNDVAVAIEHLTEIEQRYSGGSSSDRYKYSDNKKVQRIVLSLNDKIGLEYIALESEGEENGFLKATSEVIKKLMAYVRNAVEYVTQTLTSHQVTAKGMIDKASQLIGEADTTKVNDRGNDVTGFINSVGLFGSLNINGKMPQDIDNILNRELKVSRALASVNYADMISTLVKGMKNGAVADDDRLKVLNEIRESCKKDLKPLDMNDGITMRLDNDCEYFRSDICPGNMALVVTVPKKIDEFSKYSADIAKTKFNVQNVNEVNGKSKVLNHAAIIDIGRSVKIYCDEVVKSNKNQQDINRASREINLAFRKGNGGEVSALVKDFAKLTRNPHLTHTRMCLTLCARALKYAQVSMKQYNDGTRVIEPKDSK